MQRTHRNPAAEERAQATWVGAIAYVSNDPPDKTPAFAGTLIARRTVREAMGSRHGAELEAMRAKALLIDRTTRHGFFLSAAVRLRTRRARLPVARASRLDADSIVARF